MRLLLATHARGPIGGVETYLRGMAAHLRAAGCELGILYEQRAEAGGAEPDPFAGCAEFDVSALGPEAALTAARAWAPERIWAHGLAEGGLEARLRELAPAVLYAHNYDGACATGRKMHQWPRPVPCARPFDAGCIPLNFTSHCGLLNPAGFAQSYRRQRERARGLRNYAAIMVASLHMAAELRRAAGPQGPPVVVVGYPLLAPRAEVLAPSPGLPHHVLMLARLTANKGGAVLLHACARAQAQLRRRLRVTIAGDGPERARLQGLAHRLDLDAHFPGWLTPAERCQTLADADVMAVPSLWPEPYGLVGMEAAAQGVPAVAFAHGGICDWLEPGVTGESAGVVPPSARGLAAALVRALEDPAHWQALREQAWRHSAGFTPAAHLARLAPLLGMPGRAFPEFADA